MNSVIVGLQYGDEGKGRVSGYFVKDYDWSIRFNGGPNAGHTVYRDGVKYALHHLPAGAVFGKKVALDSGMVIDIDILYEECKTIKNPYTLYISNNVNMIKPEHKENDINGSGIGTTKRGIAYAYSDRALRKGWRAVDFPQMTNDISTFGYDGLVPMLPGETALLESAQGIMLDVDYGCYPYVTSSSVLPSIVHKVTKTIGVMKAYVSRVGDGPPYTDDIPELRDAGAEFGTTTGRPRKCTWFSLKDIDYALSIVRPDEIVVTKLDILDSIRPKVYDMLGKLVTFESLDSYTNFLLERYPEIKWISNKPDGDLIKVR